MMVLQKFSVHLLHGVLKLISLLPFRVLYAFADLLAFVADRVIGYRKQVVEDNLRRCFPDKSPHEIKNIRQKFYRNLADVAVETIKLMSISEKEILSRCRYTESTLDLDRFYFENKQSLVCLLGHYGNWEWLLASFFVQKTNQIAPVYRPLRLKAFDHLMLTIRGRFTHLLIPKNQVARHLMLQQRKGNPTMFGIIADQAPSRQDMLWVHFLGQDTPVYTGPERMARTFNLPVVFAVLRKEKRGEFIIHAEVISDQPSDIPEGEITASFMQKLDREIRNNPALWLWSHRRWKISR